MVLLPLKKIFKRELARHDILIAADGGANFLYKYEIVPDYLIGDLDSITKKALGFFSDKKLAIEKYSQNKDSTDADLALKKATELKAGKITFLGCTGGKRTDHFLGALGLLAKCLELDIEACLQDDWQTISLIKKSTDIHAKPDTRFSLQAYGGTVKDLNISGAKYILEDYDLEMGDTLTLSNEFKDEIVKLKFKSGKLLVFLNYV